MQHKEGNTQHNPGLLLLSNQDVERTVSYEMAIAAVEDAFRQLWLGEADVRYQKIFLRLAHTMQPQGSPPHSHRCTWSKGRKLWVYWNDRDT